MELSREQLDRYVTLCGKYGKEMAEIMMGIVEDPEKKQPKPEELSVADMINKETYAQVEDQKKNGTYKPEYQGGYSSPVKDAKENAVHSFKVSEKLSETQSKSISDMIHLGTEAIINHPEMGAYEALERETFLNRPK